MALTPVYSLPYQALTDPPHGPNLGAQLAEAVEDELARIDAAIGALGVIGGKDYNKGLGVFIGTNSGPAEFANGMDSGPVTMPPNHRFALTLSGRYLTATAAGTQLTIRIRETNLAGAIRGEWTGDFGVNGVAVDKGFSGRYKTGGAPETKTFIVTLQTSAGVVNSYNGDGSTHYVYLEVEDLGPANKVTVVV